MEPSNTSVVNLTIGQYDLVYNSLSFTIAAMGAAFVFFLMARTTVAYKFQRVTEVAALIVGIACYHYVRMFMSWTAAYTHAAGTTFYTPTGELFNEAYRYADWLLTVPLLLVELIAVLYLTGAKRAGTIRNLVIAAALMIVTGYPGEVATDNTTRFIWGVISTIPFVYILFVLWTEVGIAIKRESPEVANLLTNIRLLLLASWGVYPIAYMMPFFPSINAADALVYKQLGYSIADVVAKPLYGLMIYAIARLKTQQENAASPDGALVPHDDTVASPNSNAI